MRTFARFCLSIGATVLFAGCALRQAQDDMQLPIGTPAAVPQMQTVAGRASSPAYQVLYQFVGASGYFPAAPLIDVNGTLYGTTQGGGHDNGTVFSISTNGIEQVLYRFSRHNADGRRPWGGLVDVSGTLYGTTSFGGTGCRGGGCGTVYSTSTGGVEKVLYRFRGGSSDGATPIGGLIAVNGTLYGTTYSGGSSVCNKTCGTVYSVTIQGTEKVLHYFARSDGAKPHAGLIFANGTLYGTTRRGGSGTGCLFGHNSGCGTVFSVSKSGVERVLHSFAGDSDGGNPVASLVDVNGTLYGTTANHLLHGDAVSTVFGLTP